MFSNEFLICLMSDNTQEKGKKKSTDDSDLQCITADKENSEVPTSLLRGSMKYKYAILYDISALFTCTQEQRKHQ